MNILDTIKDLNPWKNKVSNVVEKKDIPEKKKTTSIITKHTHNRYRQMIQQWIPAINQAESVEMPSRRMLFDIFKNVELDAKVSGKMQNRINTSVLSDFKIYKGDNVDDELTDFFDNKWFRDVVFEILKSKFWGFTVLELDNIKDNMPKFNSIDRDYIQPVGKQVLKSYTDHEGVSLDDFKYTIFIGEERDLGLYTKISQYYLIKKHLTEMVMSYADRYGMPFRYAKINPDAVNQNEVFNMLKNVGQEGFGVFNESVDIAEISNNAGNGQTVYQAMLDWADEQISYLISGETMTQDQGSSYAQSLTHQKTADKTSYLDCLYLQDVVNKQLIPFLINLGYSELLDTKFIIEYDTKLPPKDQILIDQVIMGSYDLNQEYLEETYGVKIDGKKEIQAPSPFGSYKDSKDLDNMYKLKW